MRFKQLNPQPSKKYRSYNQSSLTDAYLAVKEGGIPVKRAARLYAIPTQTLRDRVLGKIDIDCVSSGRQPSLSMEEEAKVVDHLKGVAKYGYGYTRQEVVDIATDYAVRLGKRSTSKPFTLNWFRQFIKRWPELQVIKPRALEQQRAKCTSASVVSSYFDELDQILTKYDLHDKPHLIFNVDEKGITQNHVPPKVVAGKEYCPQAVTAGKSQTTTILGCGSASGMAIPPYFVFAGKRMLPELMKESTPGAAGTMSETGWSNSGVFREYLQIHFMKFIPQRNADQHLLLLLDGHKSHVSVDLLEWAKENKIVLFILPAHTSHVLQPLDVSCYGPFQKIYNSECHKLTRNTSVVTRSDVCALSCKAYSKALSAENLYSAFRKTGIYPFDRAAISTESVEPAEVFKNPSSSFESVTMEVDNETSSQPVASTNNDKTESPSIFMRQNVEKLKQIKSQISEKKERKTISKLVSGKPITEKNVQCKILEHQAQSNHKMATQSSSKKVTSQKGKQIKKSVKIGKGKKNKTHNQPCSPLPGPSRIYYPSSDSDESTTEDEKCCVCGLFTPKEIRNSVSLLFTKWVQCDKCNHWVHLKFCTDQAVIRRGVQYLCPHCH